MTGFPILVNKQLQRRSRLISNNKNPRAGMIKCAKETKTGGCAREQRNTGTYFSIMTKTQFKKEM